MPDRIDAPQPPLPAPEVDGTAFGGFGPSHVAQVAPTSDASTAPEADQAAAPDS